MSDAGRIPRPTPLSMNPEAFRAAGHRLVDELAGRLAAIADGPVTRDVSPSALREAIGLGRPLPERGTEAGELLAGATRALFERSLFNQHPRFFGYITAPPAPIGILGDLLASAVNPNCGSWALAPAATEIELETVRWIAGLIGYPTDAGGLLVSGGNMANFVCFIAARAAKAGWDVRAKGASAGPPLRAYCSSETHTWIQKATDLAGLGTDSIRWIPVDGAQRMDVTALDRRIEADLAAGERPFLVVGTAGSVSTGAVDALPAIRDVCRRHDLWFHVDGAYGGFAAAAPGAPADLRALADADSVAVDPHKWLYAPLEAGCALVRDADALRAAFSYHPPYYHFDERAMNLVDFGMQNSRGFRALKVWLMLQHAGAAGYRAMIGEDMRLSRELAEAVRSHPELELFTQALSITTFRCVPRDLRARVGEERAEAYLDTLNRTVLDRSQREGEAFVSNAVVRGRYVLRACIVNFHTASADVQALPGILVRAAARIDAELRPRELRGEAT
ncbi:MAG: aminotransferase class V-fold PLP-dependent enzyme [Candidatus Eisenbacteria bacterium]|nr:aminotransferase class V-fold PLP-dependent enzyme [Candidatus Eisenbacteria bacterium]